MAITRTRETTLVDAWGNDIDGVTLEVRGRKAHITVDEAETFAIELLNTVTEQRQTIRARQMPELDDEPAF